MPELVNIKVGSLPGTKGLEATTVCPLDAKKSKKVLRISATEIEGVLMGWCKLWAPLSQEGQKSQMLPVTRWQT